MLYEFGEFHFNESTCDLFYRQAPVKVEPQVAQLLRYFLQNKGKVLSRDDLMLVLWSDRVVTDDALRSSIKKLRDILKDDAKSPKFIKTLPMKGYEFIGEIELVTSKTSSLVSMKTKLLGTIFFLCLLVLCIWQSGIVGPTNNKPHITKLTDIAGSELLPNYDPINKRLIFSHRANKDDFLQLYVKEMDSGKVTRLTWDEANYGNPIWSPNGDRFAYIRSTTTSMNHYISEFDTLKGMINSNKLDNDILSTHYLLGWSSKKMGLYLTDKTSPSRPQGIWFFDIIRNTTEQITSPSVHGQGDYFVKESFDGTQLAILRSLSLNKHELLVLHLSTGEILYANQLPNKMHRLVWSNDDSSITLGNFDGTLLRVTLSNREIEDITPKADFVNHLFYQCGQNCYYMRQHNGNYLDIAEQPNPFSEKSIGSFGYFELSGANSFPVYANTDNKIYFFSQYGQTSRIEYIDGNGALATVLNFKNVVEIQSLALNRDDTYFVGLVDSSLFIYDINRGVFSYLSKQTDITYPPHWLDENHFVYAKLEKNEAMLYQYSLLDNTSTLLMSGYVGLLNIGLNDRLLIDKDYHLWRQQNNEVKEIGILPSSQPNRFKLVGNNIYYTDREENTNMLFKLSIDDASLNKVELAKNRFKAHFDISADQEKLAVVESLLAQSDIIKLELR
ncbi:winged helix-turn-helix domain-containing protein [Alteromonas sp. BMJM2]|uniref:winged helix-turn-helix domain-containing protein n=1 Tax=Alteromonas sp. BMJM2 TaxID=2954241 RepID=UPI0022B3019E|nr:winged helix-turn-helix domain-containing protein [Alteromonas sp. BMJM2]